MSSFEAWSSASLDDLRGIRLGRCARRILLLAPLPEEEPRAIAPERPGRAATESQRRALHRLSAIGLVELSWKSETVTTMEVARSTRVLWDPEDGVYRETDREPSPVTRTVEKRAVQLTPLGALLVDRLRPQLETGQRIRWAPLIDAEAH
jgi:hypothetical protein